MREYELTLILKADLPEETRDQIIQRVVGWMPVVTGEGVTEPVFNHWGIRQLAYPIKNLTEGYYLLIEAHMDGAGLREMERNITYVDEILRHLVVRKPN